MIYGWDEQGVPRTASVMAILAFLARRRPPSPAFAKASARSDPTPGPNRHPDLLARRLTQDDGVGLDAGDGPCAYLVPYPDHGPVDDGEPAAG